MFVENKGFSGFQRLKCSICKKGTVLISDKHKGPIICKHCKKQIKKMENY